MTPYATTLSAITRNFSYFVREDGSLPPRAIFALLAVRRVELRSIALRAGVNVKVVRAVIAGTKHQGSVEKIVAARLGLDPDLLWRRK